MTKLFIDSSKRESTLVELRINGKSFKKEHSSMFRTSQILLPLIIDLLKENNLSVKDINEIEVYPGPGSFTGLRVGVSIASALSFALNIPVNGKVFEKGPLVTPKYF